MHLGTAPILGQSPPGMGRNSQWQSASSLLNSIVFLIDHAPAEDRKESFDFIDDTNNKYDIPDGAGVITPPRPQTHGHGDMSLEIDTLTVEHAICRFSL